MQVSQDRCNQRRFTSENQRSRSKAHEHDIKCTINEVLGRYRPTVFSLRGNVASAIQLHVEDFAAVRTHRNRGFRRFRGPNFPRAPERHKKGLPTEKNVQKASKLWAGGT